MPFWKKTTPKLMHLEPATEANEEFYLDFAVCIALCLPDWKHFFFLAFVSFLVLAECHPDCLTCSHSFDHCNACRDARKQLQNGRCVESCAPGFYQDGGACLGNLCQSYIPCQMTLLGLAVLLSAGSPRLTINRLSGSAWQSSQAHPEQYPWA